MRVRVSVRDLRELDNSHAPSSRSPNDQSTWSVFSVAGPGSVSVVQPRRVARRGNSRRGARRPHPPRPCASWINDHSTIISPRNASVHRPPTDRDLRIINLVLRQLHDRPPVVADDAADDQHCCLREPQDLFGNVLSQDGVEARAEIELE